MIVVGSCKARHAVRLKLGKTAITVGLYAVFVWALFGNTSIGFLSTLPSRKVANLQLASMRVPPAEFVRSSDQDELLRRRSLINFAVGGLLSGAVAYPNVAVGSPSSESTRVNDLIEAVDVFAVTDMDGSPMLEPDPSGKLVGRFWLDQAAAVERLAKFKEAAAEAGDVKSMEVRQIPLSEVYLQLIVGGNEAQLGGQLRIEPLPRDPTSSNSEVRNAQQILAGAYLGPSGTVPLFFCSTLVLESRGISFVPAFLREKDLLETLKKAGGTGARTEITTLQNVAEKLGEQAKSGTDVGSAPQLRVVSDIGKIQNGVQASKL